ncbi:50S ribosomal protein L25/general stress protein Ctc [Vagococcus humatus]|uniref:Large ribosomal subunit protein bL25 n=1 Tax=Vagococcus humatus TaxID=1889241 RepID=A0A3R9YIM1_9ENTE|nr:50S ribosomal protein L25/general stress protein Ctc [Vagococcus humatus]RST88556.1 50S ribosomal protein L25 [Vagococcus humatus]
MATVLKVERRAVRPRSIRKQLRTEGRVPAVIYGNDIENTTISVSGYELSMSLREGGINGVYSLELDGKKIPTLIRDYQLDTFNRDWVHVEFLAVDMSVETEVEADIILVGTPAGVKAGGILTQNVHSVIVSATPDKLPDVVEVNVEGLAIGDSFTIADIPENPDYKIIAEDMGDQVAAVEEPEIPSEPEDEDAVAAEPEVIGEKEAE